MPADYRNNLYRYNSYLSERAWRSGVATFNDRLLEIGAREGLPVLDLSSRVAGRTALFRDFCHLKEAGHVEVAKQLADLLEPVLAERDGGSQGGGE